MNCRIEKSLMEEFIMLVGFPGSGKTQTCNEIVAQFGADNVDVICHDKEVCDTMKIMGHNKARGFVHKSIINRIRNPIKKVIVYDSVNFSYEGRKCFLECVCQSTTVTIIYFEPCSLIKENRLAEYVDWLHANRSTHHIFHSEKERAIETLSNIKKSFCEITDNESSQYNIIRKLSYYDTLN